jgi:CMP-N-acetylneuraminic acid synthetase/spore coat polysaccharide biosynthesis predicted glycosyltransferase SpsG
MKKICIIIPARSGSKGIPGKNTRIVGGRPLITYAIMNALSLADIADVAVTTDDENIGNICSWYDVQTIKRPEELCGDEVTLDPVVYDAVTNMEQRRTCPYDVVITIQPTSPLLQQKTLRNALEFFFSCGADTLVSVVNHPHLAWFSHEGVLLPLYKERANRQYLSAHLIETGAFVIAKRGNVSIDSRFGRHVEAYEIAPKEAIDIDDFTDLWVVEKELNRQSILFCIDGGGVIGLNRMERCMTLAYQMNECVVYFALGGCAGESATSYYEHHFPMKLYANMDELYKIIDCVSPDILVNDFGNTKADYIERLRSKGTRVVNFDDCGEGASRADIVINPWSDGPRGDHIYTGLQYAFIGHYFDQKKCTKELMEVLVSFGGQMPIDVWQGMAAATTRTNNELRFVFAIPEDLADRIGLQDGPKIRKRAYSCLKELRQMMASASFAVISRDLLCYAAYAQLPSIIVSDQATDQDIPLFEGGCLYFRADDKNYHDLVRTISWIAGCATIQQRMLAKMREQLLVFQKNSERVKEAIMGNRTYGT